MVFKGVGQLYGLGTGNGYSLGLTATAFISCFQNLYGSILDFGCYGTSSLIDVLHQLACDLNLRTFDELLYAFGQVSPVSLEYLTAILGIGHPEGLLTLADRTDNLGDVTGDGVGIF